MSNIDRKGVGDQYRCYRHIDRRADRGGHARRGKHTISTVIKLKDCNNLRDAGRADANDRRGADAGELLDPLLPADRCHRAVRGANDVDQPAFDPQSTLGV